MAHLTLLFMILILTIISPSHSEKKSTSLRFYLHVTISGKNQSAWDVVPSVSKSGFGSVTMVDNPITMFPDIESVHFGRAQGMYASADSKTPAAFLMVMTFVFNEMSGYENSTLSVLGRNEVHTKVREMPVVGGTGDFRYASGFAQAETHHINKQTAVVMYNVKFLHS